MVTRSASRSSSLYVWPRLRSDSGGFQKADQELGIEGLRYCVGEVSLPALLVATTGYLVAWACTSAPLFDWYNIRGPEPTKLTRPLYRGILGPVLLRYCEPPPVTVFV